MKTYAIFGGALRSALEFPFLRPVEARPATWTLHRSAPEPLPRDASALGDDDVDANARVRLHRSSVGWHLAYDDTGRFDVATDGRLITWHAPENASLDAARLDVTGRVLALALHAGGDLCFHASAVAIGGAAVGFLGAKGMGKSTLAWALVRAGARLLTDDTLRVRPGSPAIAYPGVHELRLRPDVATRLPPAPREARVWGDRLTVQELTMDRLQREPLPLAALYLLSPVRQPSSSGARALAVSDVAAALSLIRHAKIAPLLAGPESALLLDRVVALARRVSVRVLEVPRDFDCLDDVVDDLLVAHGAETSVPAP